MSVRLPVHPVLVVCLALFSLNAAAFENREVRIAGGIEVPVSTHAAKGSELLIWLPSGFPTGAHEERLADELAVLGIEVWRVNLLEGRFLPLLESSLDEVPDSDVSDIIAAAQRATGKRVHIAGLARGGLLALRGARDYLAREPAGRALGGALLLHPNLYTGPPEPGEEAQYHPVVAAVRLPVFLIQPENSPWRWRLDAAQSELQKSGAQVFVRLVREVRDRFYFRPDATEVEERLARELAVQIRDAVKLLAKSPLAPVSAAPPLRPAQAPGSRVRELKPYRGNPAPPPLDLATLDGPGRTLADYRGKVVVVNFWASWCPPCVHEMPSMQRLRDKLAGKPFEILAVNMAEDESAVRAFLRDKVNIRFPVLMDRDGRALKDWKVFVFPTSFVLGPDGRIACALFGEMPWDTGEVVRIVEGLLTK